MSMGNEHTNEGLCYHRRAAVVMVRTCGMQNPHGGGLFILLSCMKSKLNLASNHRQTQKTKAPYHFVPKIHGNQSQAV